MEFKAVAKYVRVSTQKVNNLAETIKGKSVEQGLNIIKFLPQKAARVVEKVIHSAVANAIQNNDVDVDKLFISNVIANQGPTLKRFRARARGRSVSILKRSGHISIILASK